MNKEIFEKEINKDLTIIDFFATWCGPCKMLSPVLEELKKTYNIVKVDVDLNPDLARLYDIMVVPTLIIFKSGKIINRISGFLDKDEVEEFINSNK